VGYDALQGACENGGSTIDVALPQQRAIAPCRAGLVLEAGGFAERPASCAR
jgi:hypothetical protein